MPSATLDAVWVRRCPLCRETVRKSDPQAPWLCGCGW